MTSTLAPVLSIAGSDSSGGAGIQADLKTMLANGVFGMTAIAALTAQNTTGVTMVTNTPPEMLAAQIDAVFEDIPPVAVKIGMVSSVELINVIADRLIAHDATNIVLDPVMVATSGAKLIEGDAIAALTSKLFPLATVITPNMPETQALCELAVEQGADAIDYENGESISSENDMVTAGHMLAGHFGCAVLVKGGHGTQGASDVLVEPSGKVTWFRARRINNPNTHGTGCTLSSAIASHLALGETLPEAVDSAKLYLTGALEAQLDLGHGSDRWITLGNGADSQIRTSQSKSYQADRNATKGTNMTLDRNAEKQEVPINPETGKPYINTLAAVAISPAGASPEKSTYVAQAVDVIRQSGLPSETNAMFTNIEGDIDDVLKVIRDATMKLAGQGYRTDVVIRLDIRPGFEGQIHAKQALVDEILSE